MTAKLQGGEYMNWDDLKILAAVRNKGSFAKAAKLLKINETTVARRLERIQSNLAEPLFDAIDGMRQPTAYCLEILSHVDEMERSVAKISRHRQAITHPVGTIRLTSTAAIAEQILAPTLAQMLLANPGIIFQHETSDENRSLSNWETDLAIRLSKPEKGAFHMRKLAEISYSLIQPKQKSDADLLCAYPQRLGDVPEMLQLAAELKLNAARLVTSNLRLIQTALKSGRAIGVLPSHMAGAFEQDSKFITQRLERKREAWLLIQPHLREDPATRIVINWVVSSFAML